MHITADTMLRAFIPNYIQSAPGIPTARPLCRSQPPQLPGWGPGRVPLCPHRTGPAVHQWVGAVAAFNTERFPTGVPACQAMPARVDNMKCPPVCSCEPAASALGVDPKKLNVISWPHPSSASSALHQAHGWITSEPNHPPPARGRACGPATGGTGWSCARCPQAPCPGCRVWAGRTRDRRASHPRPPGNVAIECSCEKGQVKGAHGGREQLYFERGKSTGVRSEGSG